MIMSFAKICVFGIFFANVVLANETLIKSYPANFMWGTATSSYQIEGAWNADGKGLSIWDTFTQKPNKIKDGSSGKNGCNSYYEYKEDVKLLKYLGVTHYRFSISWPRILPKGTAAGGVNQKGIDYYKNVVRELLANGIEPMVTLYHWDLPQELENVGGWKNVATIDAFVEFAELMFTEIGKNVKMWITFNEPWVTTWLGYGNGYHAPGISEPGQGVYTVAHNILLAHSRVYHVYKNNYKNLQKGRIGITLNGAFAIPKNSSNKADVEAAERAMQFDFGWFANPIFKNGDYPEVMRRFVDRKSREQGFNSSRLPTFTADQSLLLKGSSDFFGLNFYSSNLVEDSPNSGNASYENDQDLAKSANVSWKGSGSTWLKVTPFGFRGILNWIKKTYGEYEIFVTENGVSDNTGTLTDDDRVSFYDQYIENMRLAMVDDKVRVSGYMAWSLLDNFEWAEGFTEKFGLYSVDLSSFKRTQKNSALWYKNYITSTRKSATVNHLNYSFVLMSTIFYVVCFNFFKV